MVASDNPKIVKPTSLHETTPLDLSWLSKSFVLLALISSLQVFSSLKKPCSIPI